MIIRLIRLLIWWVWRLTLVTARSNWAREGLRPRTLEFIVDMALLVSVTIFVLVALLRLYRWWVGIVSVKQMAVAQPVSDSDCNRGASDIASRKHPNRELFDEIGDRIRSEMCIPPLTPANEMLARQKCHNAIMKLIDSNTIKDLRLKDVGFAVNTAFMRVFKPTEDDISAATYVRGSLCRRQRARYAAIVHVPMPWYCRIFTNRQYNVHYDQDSK